MSGLYRNLVQDSGWSDTFQILFENWSVCFGSSLSDFPLR
jgi:hypothetical protein